MKVKIWGARGECPVPASSPIIRDKLITAIEGARGLNYDDPQAVRRYVDSLGNFVNGTVGGNTPCVEVQADDQPIIIDAGSGIRALGWELMAGPCGQGKGVIHLLLSHTHLAHIEGFPFFEPLYVPGNRIYIYSVHDVAKVLARQMSPETFTIPYDYISDNLTYVPLQEGEKVKLGELTLSTLCLPHPGRAYAFRLEQRGVSLVYASDAEYKHLDEFHLEPYLRFYAGADALIYDAQYTLREALMKIDYGHSTPLHGADIARRAGVKRLILFHHDPKASDHDLAAQLTQTRNYQRGFADESECEILLAHEGLELNLGSV